jgi:hypothetical protein
MVGLRARKMLVAARSAWRPEVVAMKPLAWKRGAKGLRTMPARKEWRYQNVKLLLIIS